MYVHYSHTYAFVYNYKREELLLARVDSDVNENVQGFNSI